MELYIVINFDPKAKEKLYHFCSLEFFYKTLLQSAEVLPRTTKGEQINIQELTTLLQIQGLVKLKHSSGRWFILNPGKY